MLYFLKGATLLYAGQEFACTHRPSLFEQEDPQFDITKTQTHGKIFVLERDRSGDGRIDYQDLEWQYMEGDGDFRSKEVCKLRDEADIIVTNPPFSLFREFLAWIVAANKQFLIIGNMNAISYKEVFPLITMLILDLQDYGNMPMVYIMRKQDLLNSGTAVGSLTLTMAAGTSLFH